MKKIVAAEKHTIFLPRQRTAPRLGGFTPGSYYELGLKIPQSARSAEATWTTGAKARYQPGLKPPFPPANTLYPLLHKNNKI
jgi:hypothetical protein